MYCSSLTSDLPVTDLLVNTCKLSVTLCLEIQLLILESQELGQSGPVRRSCSSNWLEQVLALLLPIAVLNISVARQPMYGCLERKVWLADHSP